MFLKEKKKNSSIIKDQFSVLGGSAWFFKVPRMI
jgi:hypothetical protein